MSVLPMAGSQKEIIIEPTRSALVIIDMQNFFLHPKALASCYKRPFYRQRHS
jgi:isochorismate hydrolase